MKEDVKEKTPRLPPLEGVGVVTYIQPRHILRGVVGLGALGAARSNGNATPRCLSQLDGFMKQCCSTPFGSEATQAKRWLKCQS
jgi:hypothetical protein